ASEDRLGTWRHLLVAVRSPRRIFAAKALASLTIIMLLAIVLTASGIVGGLGSIAFGRSPLGLVLPALLALALQIGQLLPLPAVVRVALPSYAFIGWRGLFTDPAQSGPLLVGVVVSLSLAVAACALAYRLFVHRDFTDLSYDGVGRRVLLQAVLPLTILVAVAVGTIAVTTPA